MKQLSKYGEMYEKFLKEVAENIKATSGEDFDDLMEEAISANWTNCTCAEFEVSRIIQRAVSDQNLKEARQNHENAKETIEELKENFTTSKMEKCF